MGSEDCRQVVAGAALRVNGFAWRVFALRVKQGVPRFAVRQSTALFLLGEFCFSPLALGGVGRVAAAGRGCSAGVGSAIDSIRSNNPGMPAGPCCACAGSMPSPTSKRVISRANFIGVSLVPCKSEFESRRRPLRVIVIALRRAR